MARGVHFAGRHTAPGADAATRAWALFHRLTARKVRTVRENRVEALADYRRSPPQYLAGQHRGIANCDLSLIFRQRQRINQRILGSAR